MWPEGLSQRKVLKVQIPQAIYECDRNYVGSILHCADLYINFDVLLTVHHSIILEIDQLNAQILVL